MELSYTSSLPVILISVVIFFLAYLLLNRSTFYSTLIKNQEHGRFESLDGLRGFLSLGVFFQHAVTNHTYFLTNTWLITEERLFRHLGGEAVILFFMITGFLYWSKAIAKKGNIDIASLYKNRFFRLAPMYIFSAGVVSVIVLINSRFHIYSIAGYFRDIVSWATLGIVTTLSMNQQTIIPINAGIHWTLHFEWIFYLLFPLAALTLRNKSFWIIILPFAALLILSGDRGYWMIFLFGMLAAHVVDRFPTFPWAKKSIATLIPIVGFVTIYLIQNKPYSIIQYIITFVLFLFLIYGNNFFGLLRSKGARFLGTISYSIYLLHGIVLYLILHITNKYIPINSVTPLFYWYLILVSGVLTIVISAITYRYVEHFFLLKMKGVKLETSASQIAERIM